MNSIESDSPPPRIEELLGRIRHNWQLTEPREPITIPKAILLIADCLLRFQPDLIGTWSDVLQQAYRRPETAMGFWTSLVHFAGDNGAMAVCDHREEIQSVVAKLSSIRSCNDIPGILRHHSTDDETIDSLCRNVASSLASANLYLASIDSGGDTYWLTVNNRDSLIELENLLAAALSDPPMVNIY